MSNKIKITPKDIKLCLDFANKIISGNDQYNRVDAEKDIRIQRTCVGKLGELAYLKYIRENFNVDYSEGDMFEIFEGQTNVDGFDFITDSGETVDVKTAFLPNHKNVTIPDDQFENCPKDHYVAVRLNGDFLSSEDKSRVDLNSITVAEIKGVLSREEIEAISSSDMFGPSARYCNLNNFKNDKLKY